MKSRRVSEIMSTPVITARRETEVIEVIRLLWRWRIGGVPIVEERRRLIGIVCEHDIINLSLDGYAGSTRAGEVMTADVITLPPEATLVEATNCLVTQRLRRIPIVEKDEVVGIVCRRDLLREMLAEYPGGWPGYPSSR